MPILDFNKKAQDLIYSCSILENFVKLGSKYICLEKNRKMMPGKDFEAFFVLKKNQFF
jgi:hypothetical protein